MYLSTHTQGSSALHNLLLDVVLLMYAYTIAIWNTRINELNCLWIE